MDLLREIEILRYLLEQIGSIELFIVDLDEEAFLRNDLVKMLR